jgi:hypothetical protein
VVRVEERLPGGNTGGAVRIGDTVRRRAGPWTPAVQALLAHLHDVGFDRCPRPLGVDERGREVLSYMPGAAVGDLKPWPSWVHSDAALVDVAHWLRDYHAAAATFVPPADAEWRGHAPSGAGAIICHNDAAPYNACWNHDGLVGFFDWDFAGPGTPEWDLAFTACAWVPLHARRVAFDEGFRAFDDRRRRLETFLGAYGWTGDVERLVLDTLRQRLISHIADVEQLAAQGDALFQALIAAGTTDAIRDALHELPGVLLPPPA